jgi:hypothetical protein
MGELKGRGSGGVSLMRGVDLPVDTHPLDPDDATHDGSGVAMQSASISAAAGASPRCARQVKCETRLEMSHVLLDVATDGRVYWSGISQRLFGHPFLRWTGRAGSWRCRASDCDRPRTSAIPDADVRVYRLTDDVLHKLSPELEYAGIAASFTSSVRFLRLAPPTRRRRE